MKKLLFLLFLAACQSPEPTHHVAQSLQEDGSFLRSSYDESSVDRLYQNLLEKDTVLQNLDKKIRTLSDNHSQKVKTYRQFDENNQKFYDEAQNFLVGISDTVLAQQIQVIVEKNRRAYLQKTQTLRQIDQQNQAKNQQINSFYQVFKLLTTLKAMQDYQKNLPSAKDLEQVSKEKEELIQELSKKIRP